MSKLAERLRWRIVTLLDKLRGQCWADLAWWALGRSESRSPWSPMGSTCRRDADRIGSCYCGKLRKPEDGAR